MKRLMMRNERGAAAIEFAIAVPVLVMMIWGMFQIGLLFQANAGMQHALGEAARYATLYPTPTDAQIKARVASKKFGTQNGTLSELSITNVTVASSTSGGGGSTTAAKYKNMSLTYSMPMNFLFMSGPTVTLVRNKRVYVVT